jgi:hypothetical protein
MNQSATSKLEATAGFIAGGSAAGRGPRDASS